MSIKKLTKYHDMPNIASSLDEDRLVKIGDEVVSNFDMDERSRADWMDKYNEAMKLAAQVVENKTYPWEGAANVKFPLLTEAALQFNARAYPALVSGTDIVKARTVGYDGTGHKQESAIRVSKHMSYQLLEEMEEWEENMDKLLMAVPIIGCMFKKTYFDPIKGRNCSIAVHPREFVVDYDTESLDSAYRKTHVMHYTANDIRKNARSGIFSEVELGEPNIQNASDTTKDQLSGSTALETTGGTPYKLLEQHTYLDLDGDGVEEPYIITVDYQSKQVLRIFAGFDLDEVRVNDKGEIYDIPQTQYFVKFGFIPSPDGGFYDMGFGQFLGPINKTVDSIINQLLDSGHMSMLGGGFLSRGVRVKMGNMGFRPNEWKSVNSTGDDLRKGIVPLPTKEPSNVMFQLLGMMINQAQRIASTVDSMVGENPGQNQKATTTLAVIEQGTKVFSGIYKRLHRAFKQELKLLFVLNSKYMDAEEYFTVLDPNIPVEQIGTVMQEDYNADIINIVPAADTGVTSMQQKMMKAQALMELAQTGLISMPEVVKRNLEAQEQPAIDVLMQVQPQGPSIEEQQFELEKQQFGLDQARFQLEVVKVKQDDVKIQAGAIKDLASAEAAEEGTQLDVYKTELKTLVDMTKAIGANNGRQAAESRSERVETK